MLHGTTVSSSDRFRKHYKIVYCLPLCTSNIVWVGEDTIDRALRHNCVISTTTHVTQTADQITSPNKPNRNHNHNAQPPTQTHIPEVCFRVTLPTMWNQLAELTVQQQEIYWCRDESNNWGHTGKQKSANTHTDWTPTVIFALLFLLLTYISVFLVKQEHYNTKWGGKKAKNNRKHVNQQKLLQNINWAF